MSLCLSVMAGYNSLCEFLGKKINHTCSPQLYTGSCTLVTVSAGVIGSLRYSSSSSRPTTLSSAPSSQVRKQPNSKSK